MLRVKDAVYRVGKINDHELFTIEKIGSLYLHVAYCAGYYLEYSINFKHPGPKDVTKQHFCKISKVSKVVSKIREHQIKIGRVR